MTTALTLPGIDAGIWQVRRKSDVAGRVLADRHYSRQTPGSRDFTPPGKVLVLVTPCERAVWASVHTLYPDDGLDAVRCTIFRNEGAGLSSELILEAMRLTEDAWGGLPADGWVTWVDRRRVASPNPGYCFKVAGWWRDVTYEHPHLTRLRACA